MRRAALLALSTWTILGAPAFGDDIVVIPIRAEQTSIAWTLAAPLHEVHGNFAVKDGSLRFDPRSDSVAGDVTIDLTTGQSGNAKRDANMRNEVLETAKYPLAVYSARSVAGHLVPSGTSHLLLAGSFLIHGSRHELTLPLDVESRDGRIEGGTTHFTIPYVAWGMRNPSIFFVHVGDHVDIDVHLTAQAANAGKLP